MVIQNKEEDIKEVQRMLLKKDYSIRCVRDIGEWMKKHLETSKDYINKPEFRDFLNKLSEEGKARHSSQANFI